MYVRTYVRMYVCMYVWKYVNNIYSAHVRVLLHLN